MPPSATNVCRLCVNVYESDDSKRLYNDSGRGTQLYDIIYKYFHPTILDMHQWRHLVGICLLCWQHICDFHTFQTNVLVAQLQLIDEDKEFEIKSEVLDVITNSPSIAAEPDIKDEPPDDQEIADRDLTNVFVRISTNEPSPSDVKSKQSNGNPRNSAGDENEVRLCESNIDSEESRSNGNLSPSVDDTYLYTAETDNIRKDGIFQTTSSTAALTLKPRGELTLPKVVNQRNVLSSRQSDLVETEKDVYHTKIDSNVAQDEGNISRVEESEHFSLCEDYHSSQESPESGPTYQDTIFQSFNTALVSGPPEDFTMPIRQNARNIVNSEQSDIHVSQDDLNISRPFESEHFPLADDYQSSQVSTKSDTSCQDIRFETISTTTALATRSTEDIPQTYTEISRNFVREISGQSDEVEKDFNTSKAYTSVAQDDRSMEDLKSSQESTEAETSSQGSIFQTARSTAVLAFKPTKDLPPPLKKNARNIVNSKQSDMDVSQDDENISNPFESEHFPLADDYQSSQGSTEVDSSCHNNILQTIGTTAAPLSQDLFINSVQSDMEVDARSSPVDSSVALYNGSVSETIKSQPDPLDESFQSPQTSRKIKDYNQVSITQTSSCPTLSTSRPRVYFPRPDIENSICFENSSQTDKNVNRKKVAVSFPQADKIMSANVSEDRKTYSFPTASNTARPMVYFPWSNIQSSQSFDSPLHLDTEMTGRENQSSESKGNKNLNGHKNVNAKKVSVPFPQEVTNISSNVPKDRKTNSFPTASNTARPMVYFPWSNIQSSQSFDSPLHSETEMAEEDNHLTENALIKSLEQGNVCESNFNHSSENTSSLPPEQGNVCERNDNHSSQVALEEGNICKSKQYPRDYQVTQISTKTNGTIRDRLSQTLNTLEAMPMDDSSLTYIEKSREIFQIIKALQSDANMAPEEVCLSKNVFDSSNLESIYQAVAMDDCSLTYIEKSRKIIRIIKSLQSDVDLSTNVSGAASPISISQTVNLLEAMPVDGTSLTNVENSGNIINLNISLQSDIDMVQKDTSSSKRGSSTVQNGENVSQASRTEQYPHKTSLECTETNISSRNTKPQKVNNIASMELRPTNDSPLLEKSKDPHKSRPSEMNINEKVGLYSKVDSTMSPDKENVSSSSGHTQYPQGSKLILVANANLKENILQDGNDSPTANYSAALKNVPDIENSGNFINLYQSEQKDENSSKARKNKAHNDDNVSSSTCDYKISPLAKDNQEPQAFTEPLDYVTEPDASTEDNDSLLAETKPENVPYNLFRTFDNQRPENITSSPQGGNSSSSTYDDYDNQPSVSTKPPAIHITSAITDRRSIKSLNELNILVAQWQPILKCDLCPEWSCSLLTLLEDHFRQQHPTEKCFISCCDRKLNSRYVIKSHLLQHINSNSLKKCDHCDKKFLTKHALKNHLHSHFKSEQQGAEEKDLLSRQTVYQCNECFRSFTRKMSLTQHSWFKHGKHRNYKC